MNFVPMKVKDFLAISTYNATKLYELLSMMVHTANLGKNEVILDINYLREFFEGEDADTEESAEDFVARVIDASVKAICEETTMQVTHRQVRKDESLCGVGFSIAWKKAEEVYVHTD